MRYKKQGLPEEGELVLCTVTKIQYNSVFANLDEYDKTGMIHISEIAPGRIRNIRDYVREGKVVICKILNVNLERGHIDLSLRRVTEIQKRNKSDEIKLEQKSENIIENLAKSQKKEFKELYDSISKSIFKKYPDIHTCFQDVVAGNASLEALGIQKKTAKELTDIIQQKMRPKEVELKGRFTLKSYLPNGAVLIKDIFKSAIDKNINITYEGAGKYRINIKSLNYKTGEKIIDQIVEDVLAKAKKQGCECSFTRDEAK